MLDKGPDCIWIDLYNVYTIHYFGHSIYTPPIDSLQGVVYHIYEYGLQENVTLINNTPWTLQTNSF